MESYYDILGVTPVASQAQLRSAYRRAARTAHPDTGGDVAAFHAVQIAWATLKDPRLRAQYDASHQTRDHTHPSTAAAATPNNGPSTHQPTREKPEPSPRWARAAVITVFVASGSLTWLILADLGAAFSIAAGLYLATLLVLIAGARHLSPRPRTLNRLLYAAWVQGAAFIALGLIHAATGRSPWPGLLWGACALTFAASATALSRPTDDTLQNRPRPNWRR